MAALTLSGPTGYQGGTASASNKLVGNVDGNNHVLRYSFKTPSSGYVTVLKFATTFHHGFGDAVTTFNVRLKLTESATSHIDAGPTTTDYDATISMLGTSDHTKSCTIGGLWLKPNTTYYLYLFPGTQYFTKYCYNSTGADQSTLTADAIAAAYALSISAGTGSSVTVKRKSSPSGATGTLSNGATIYDGDELTITFAASTGYSLSKHTVNGSAFTSGGTHKVTSAVAVVSTAALKTFKLSISAGTGSIITVKRSGTALSNGATITYGDELTITFGVSTGYNLGTHTVNGSTFASGDTHTVTDAVAVAATASLKAFKLSISAGTGSVIIVKRNGTALSNGATITYGDVLTITFGANNNGYALDTHTVNGSVFTSGETHTVTGAVAVVSTATVKSFTLSIRAGTGSKITVTRTESPLHGAGTGQLIDGAVIYYNDVLSITFDGSALYEIRTGTVNGESFTSGETHTVTGAVVVVTTTRILGFVYLTVGGIVKKFRVIVHHNGSWRKYRPRILHSNTDISAFGAGDAIVITTSLPVTTDGDTIIIGGA